MPILVTPMGQGLLPAGQQTILGHDGRSMHRVAVQHKVSMPEIFSWLHQLARGCCLQAEELTAHSSGCELYQPHQ